MRRDPEFFANRAAHTVRSDHVSGVDPTSALPWAREREDVAGVVVALEPKKLDAALEPDASEGTHVRLDQRLELVLPDRRRTRRAHKAGLMTRREADIDRLPVSGLSQRRGGPRLELDL